MKRLTAVICASVLALSSVTAYAGSSISDLAPENVAASDVVGEIPAGSEITVTEITPEMMENFSDAVKEIITANNTAEGTTLTVDEVAEKLDGEVIGEKPEEARYLTQFSALVLTDGNVSFDYDEEGNVKSYTIKMDVPQLSDLTDEDKENTVLQVIDPIKTDTQYCKTNWDEYKPDKPTTINENIQLFGICAFAQAGLASAPAATEESLAEAPDTAESVVAEVE